VSDLALLITIVDVVGEEVRVDGVDDLSRDKMIKKRTYVEHVLPVQRPLKRLKIRQVLLVSRAVLDLLEDLLGCELVKVRNINNADLFVLEGL